MEARQMMTTKQVARRLSVSVGRVYQLREAERLTGIRVADIWVFDYAEVERFASQPRKIGRPRKAK